MSEKWETVTVGDIVGRDYRNADVFEKYGIDFCCGGNVTVAEACRQKGVDPAQLSREIDEIATQPADQAQDFAAMDLPALADHIVNTHHVYLKENTASIAAYADKIAEVHGDRHPEVIEIAAIFHKIAADMTLHLQNEEEVLFPTIKKLASEGAKVEGMQEVLEALTHDHDEIGAAIHEIRRLADNYKVPGDVCNTFMVTYQKLKEFEDDLHKHVHLENNILFPKAAKAIA
jgi:regulator of cell morphogenesis and NO signaling